MRDLKLYDHRMISWYYSIPTVPSHLMCSCSQHTVFWLSFFPQRLEFSLKGRKSLIILLVEDATHFWFFFSAQYSRLRQALQPIKFQICLKRFKGKDTLLCFFLSIFGHFSKSHHILWQKNEMKDVFPAVKCQNCSNLTWTVCEG